MSELFSRRLCGATPILALLLLSVAALLVPSSPAARRPAQDAPSARSARAQAATASRVSLQPRFAPGDVLRYEVEFETQSATSHGGIIQDPQGPTQLTISWNATIRIDVLRAAAPPQSQSAPARSVAAPASAATAPLRIRVTYEKSVVSVQSDSPDPERDAIEKQYAQLAGQSMEFALTRRGQVATVTGLEGIIGDEKARDAARQWMEQLLGPGAAPSSVLAGQHWTSNHPATSAPLAGFVWRSDSSYLREESCRPDEPAPPGSPAAADRCAVVLTQLALVKDRAPRDPTPEDYRRKGLRTSGSWSGAAHGLSYISLKNGWIVSSNQEGGEQMDVVVKNPAGLDLHYAATVRTRTSMSLVPPGTP